MSGDDVRSSGSKPLSDTIEQLKGTIDDDLGAAWRREFALIGLLVAIVAVVALVALRADSPSVQRVFVHIDSDLYQEHAWIAPGFRQSLRSYIEASERLRVVEPTASHGSIFSQPELTSSSQSGLLATSARADWLVSVRLSAPIDVGRVSVEVAILSTADQQSLHSATLHSDVEGLSDLAARVALQVFDWLAVDPFDSVQRRSAAALTPRATPAMESFSRALTALDQQDARSALQHLELALAASPEHPAVHAMRAQAYELLGYRDQARQEINRAVAVSEGLPREHKLAIEAQRSLLRSDWAGAVERYGALATFYPEEPRYGLALAAAMVRQRDLEGAHRALDRVAAISFQNDPRVSLMRARVFYESGQWAPGLAAVELAIDSAEQLGHRGNLADALMFAAEMGADDEIELLNRAEALFAELNNPVGQSRVLRERGAELRALGLLAEAEAAFNDALAIAQKLGNDAELASGKNGLAIVYDLQGRLEQGLLLKGEVLANYRRRDIPFGVGITLEAMVISLQKLGRLSEADNLLDEAASHFSATDDAIGRAWVPYRRARIAIARGDLEGARALLEQALANSDERPEGSLREHAGFELARLNARQRMPSADVELRASIQAYEEAKLDLDRGIALVALAHQRQDVGATAEAGKLLSEAAGTFRAKEAHYYLAQALFVPAWTGDSKACAEMSSIQDQIGHRSSELLAHIALQRCGMPVMPITQLQADVDESELLEPKVYMLALTDPQEAARLARAHGWTAEAAGW